MYFHLPVVADPLLHHSAAMNEIHGTLVTGCLLILLLDQQIDLQKRIIIPSDPQQY